MSVQFVNASGQSVLLTQGGQTLTLPFGFSGALAATGSYSVNLGGTLVSGTQTNVVQTTPTKTNGLVWVELAVYGGPINVGGNLTAFAHAPGQPFYYQNSAGDRVTPPVPDTGHVIAQFSDDPGIWVGWEVVGTTYSTNVVTTNAAVGGANLGTVQLSDFTREVVVGTQQVAVQTYQQHFEVAGWGFAIGCVIFFHRWVLNVLSAMGREEDL